MQGVVLVVDDRIRPRRALAVELVQAADGAEAWKLFCRHAPDVVITDLVMPRCDGIELLTRIRARSDVPVILFTARGSVQAAATAFKAGADEFVASPDVEVEELVELVTTATGERRATREPPDLARRLVGRSEAATRIRERISGLIPLWTPVLVCGEPGTGHDTVALALHELGASAGGRFTRFEAASFSPRQELPSRGAVYLDGAERLPADGQAFWAERIVKAETSSFQPNLRVLASTTEHLLSRLRDGSYDAQLGTLLLRFAIDLPPLRDRAEDVCDIADALTEKIGRAVEDRARRRQTHPTLERREGADRRAPLARKPAAAGTASRARRGLLARPPDPPPGHRGSVRGRGANAPRDPGAARLPRAGRPAPGDRGHRRKHQPSRRASRPQPRRRVPPAREARNRCPAAKLRAEESERWSS
jgi:DNA-binding NtrC family response regulator